MKWDMPKSTSVPKFEVSNYTVPNVRKGFQNLQIWLLAHHTPLGKIFCHPWGGTAYSYNVHSDWSTHVKNHKHKINLNYNGATVEVFFCWTASVVCMVRRQVRLIRKFRIGPSLSNRIGIVRFEFESNFKALQVPKWKLYNKNSY